MRAIKVENSDRLAQIAECLDVHVDNDQDGSNRLFLRTIYTNSLDMNEKEYTAMEKDINEFSITGQGFNVDAWNDSSGYNYWNVRQEEDNYIQITIQIAPRARVDIAQLNKAIAKAQNHFAHYSRSGDV